VSEVGIHGRGGQSVVTAVEMLSVAEFLEGTRSVRPAGARYSPRDQFISRPAPGTFLSESIHY
jgi:hypothetical protein